MKAEILNHEGNKVREIELPACFESEIRKDIIHKAFVISQFGQPYGTYILAGKKVSASGKQSHSRRKWKTLYGKGVSRVPRKTMSSRGDRFYWIGAFIPGTVKGRTAMPPLPFKRRGKINKKEKKIAINSAIAATASKEIIEKKYPNAKIKSLPVIIESSLVDKKPKEIIMALEKIFGMDIEAIRKIRAGKGKKRGRKYRKIIKIVLIVSSKEKEKKLENFGVDVKKINQLNISNLAPGGTPGRLVAWTENAIAELGERK
jgi:large subunit ribosomal protein L4e